MYKYYFLVLIIILSSCGKKSEWTTKSDEALDFYLKGREAHVSFNSGKALDLYKKSFQADTSFAVVALFLADIYFDDGNKDSAKYFIEKSHQLVTKASRYEKLIINSTYAKFMGNGEKAKLMEDSLMTEYADRLDVKAMIARKAFANADYDLCREKYFEIIEEYPEYAMAYNMIGYSYAMQGYYRDAQMYFKKYVETAPNILNPYDSMAEFYMITGKYHETIDFLGKLVDEKKSSLDQNRFLAAVIYLKIADAYQNLGQLSKAIEYAEIAKNYLNSVQAAMHQINNFLFYLYFDLDDVDGMKNEYDRIKSNIPKVESNYLNILVKIKERNYIGAEKEIDDFCSKIQYKEKNYIKFVAILEGELAFARERYAVASDKFKTAVGIKGDIYPARIQNKYYISLGLDGKIDEAIEGLESILAKNPNNPVSLINICQFYYENDEVNKAKFYMQHLLKLWENADKDSPMMLRAMELKQNLQDY